MFANVRYTLGLCYGNCIGEEVEQKAVEQYQKAAKQEDASAQFNLGVCYRNGIGVEKDEQKAVELYQKLLNKEMPLLNLILEHVIKLVLE